MGQRYTSLVAREQHDGNREAVPNCLTCCAFWDDHYADTLGKRGAKGKYPWEAWFDGRRHYLRQGEDFPNNVTATKFRATSVYNAATYRNFRLVTEVRDNDQTLVIKAFPKTPDTTQARHYEGPHVSFAGYVEWDDITDEELERYNRGQKALLQAERAYTAPPTEVEEPKDPFAALRRAPLGPPQPGQDPDQLFDDGS